MAQVIEGIERINAIPSVVLPDGASRRIKPVTVTDVDADVEEVKDQSNRGLIPSFGEGVSNVQLNLGITNCKAVSAQRLNSHTSRHVLTT